MMGSETLLNAYLEANVVLVFGFALWRLVRFALGRLGLGRAFIGQLRAMTVVLAAMALTPLAMLGVGLLRAEGWLGAPLTISDIAVAHYLNGQIKMPAADFEALIAMRETGIRGFLDFAHPVAWIIAGVALAGFVIAAVRLGWSGLSVWQVLRRCHVWRRLGTVSLLVSDEITMPFSTRGWRRHYVVVPSSLLARPADLSMVLAHEFQHIRQGDLAWEIGMEVIRPFFFWNPAMHLWKREVEQLRELACDQRLVERGRLDVRAYCACLLRFCRENIAVRRALPGVAFVEARRRPFLYRRLMAVAEARQARAPRAIVALVAVPVVLAVGALSLALQQPADWSQDRLMLSTIVNLERLNARNALATR
ncbi:M56 family metallopeptidase [Algicella marina]|uniref:Biotin transporter BioY n=1 Tax=Algicella marina TaxID=2683284 RepID=A0A6P1T1J7_9RHOB|nr:M56 family metallopeptidase [Algicella marina]QHQ35857.1 biotin transporter BioY [Algicella marina]